MNNIKILQLQTERRCNWKENKRCLLTRENNIIYYTTTASFPICSHSPYITILSSHATLHNLVVIVLTIIITNVLCDKGCTYRTWEEAQYVVGPPKTHTFLEISNFFFTVTVATSSMLHAWQSWRGTTVLSDISWCFAHEIHVL